MKHEHLTVLRIYDSMISTLKILCSKRLWPQARIAKLTSTNVAAVRVRTERRVTTPSTSTRARAHRDIKVSVISCQSLTLVLAFLSCFICILVVLSFERCLMIALDTHCTTDINECASGPCQNLATCNDLVNHYTCDCTSGWSGKCKRAIYA